MQSPAEKNDNEIRVRRQASSHALEEVLAQSICDGIARNKRKTGWVYAVQRLCRSTNRETCTSLCTSNVLRGMDSQTAHSTWSAIDSIHVYYGSPSSSPGNRTNPDIGLKVLWYNSIALNDCGPNYCCCHAA